MTVERKKGKTKMIVMMVVMMMMMMVVMMMMMVMMMMVVMMMMMMMTYCRILVGRHQWLMSVEATLALLTQGR